MIKICITCKEYKSLGNFHKAKNKFMGVHYVCKTCKSTYDRARKKPSRPWNTLTDEEKAKKYTTKKLWLAKKRASKPPRTFKSKEDKQLVKREANRRYEQNNKIRRLSQRLRRRLKRVITRHRDANFSKNGHFGSMIGCSGPELIKHLESTWYSGMTWDNYGWGSGKWVIDHIRPIIDFYRKGEDLRLANHYSNLRALWYEDNAKKSVEDKYGTFPNPSLKSTPEHEPKLESEGDTDIVLKGGQ